MKPKHKKKIKKLKARVKRLEYELAQADEINKELSKKK